MKKGQLYTGILLVFAIASIWAFSQYSTGEGDRAAVSEITGNAVALKLEGDQIIFSPQNAMFEFEGYAVGKSHVGSFNSWSGTVFKDNSEISGIEFEIQVDSVNTGIERLDSHLISDDFFDSTVYPEISFVTTDISDSQITGNLEFRGITKKITFPYDEDSETISANFFIDTEPFNFKYTAVNPEVRVAFSIPLN